VTVTPAGDAVHWELALDAGPGEAAGEVSARSDLFGDPPVVQLAGADVREATGPGTGVRLDVDLSWKPAAERPVPDGTVFVHLAEANGHPLASGDAPPTAGRYPPRLWRPSEAVADRHALPLDGVPPGRYRLLVGWYDPADGRRWPARDGQGGGWPDGAVELGQVEIGPAGARFSPAGEASP
jgi:hypothetical protein